MNNNTNSKSQPLFMAEYLKMRERRIKKAKKEREELLKTGATVPSCDVHERQAILLEDLSTAEYGSTEHTFDWVAAGRPELWTLVEVSADRRYEVWSDAGWGLLALFDVFNPKHIITGKDLLSSADGKVYVLEKDYHGSSQYLFYAASLSVELTPSYPPKAQHVEDVRLMLQAVNDDLRSWGFGIGMDTLDVQASKQTVAFKFYSVKGRKPALNEESSYRLRYELKNWAKAFAGTSKDVNTQGKVAHYLGEFSTSQVVLVNVHPGDWKIRMKFDLSTKQVTVSVYQDLAPFRRDTFQNTFFKGTVTGRTSCAEKLLPKDGDS